MLAPGERRELRIPWWATGPTGNLTLSGALAAAALAMSQLVGSGSSRSWARASAGSFVLCTCLLLSLPLAGERILRARCGEMVPAPP